VCSSRWLFALAAPTWLGAAAFCALLGALAGGFAACIPPPERSPTGTSQSPDHLVAPATVDVSRVKLEPGLAQVAVAVGGQGTRGLALWVPDEAPGPHPLVVFLHGAGGGKWLLGSRGILACLVTPALEPLHPIIVAPVSSSGGQWWMEDDISFVLGLVEAARKSWPVAAEKPLLLGYSNGGIGTWFFARQYPDSFSAAIPMAANDTIVGATPVPVYAISGDKDELFPIADMRRAIAAAQATGQNVTLHEKYRGTHMQACSYVPELEAARDWVTSTVWKTSVTGSR
jgi:predicted esterase